MSELADRSIIALRHTHDDLADRVAGFSDDDLARTSGATEWDVAHVLGHLGSSAEINLALLTAGLAGDPAPDNEFSQGVWDRWNAMDRRAKADGFVTTDERLVGTVESLSAEARETASFTWFLPYPVGIELYAGMRLSEIAQHQWDVLVAFDPAATIPVETAGVALDVLTGPAGFMIGFVGKPEALAGATANLAVRTTDPARELGLSLGPQIAIGPVPDKPDGELAAPAEAVNRLIAGRLRPEHTPDGVELTGPITLDQLRRVFPGF